MNRDILLFRISCISFGVSAFSFVLSFLGDYRGNAISVVFAVIIGVLFWLGLIAGAAFLFIINKHRKKAGGKKTANRKKHIGAITFFSNRYAMIADIAMAVFLVLTILLGFIPGVAREFAMVSLSFFIFAVYMHCVLNGINYKYINSIKEESKK